jgi:hypothetical protein
MESPQILPGAGIAAVALNLLVVRLLIEKGALSKQDMTDALDGATLLVQELSPDIPLRQSVHEILQGILSMIADRGALPTDT